jgi:hypothetical protein
MIPLCSRFDSVLFTPKMFRIASYGDYSRSPYPASVRAWLARHGGLTPNMKFVQGRDLAAIVAPCDKASRAVSLPHARHVSGALQAHRVDLRRARADAR